MNRAALAKRDARIIKLREAGKTSMTEIGARFGLSKGRVSQIVLKLRSDLKPSDRDSRIVSMVRDGASRKSLSLLFGLTEERISQIVVCWAQELTKSEHDWSVAEVRMLRKLRERGLSYGAIGKTMGITKDAAIGKARRIGLTSNVR